ncbi:FAD-binding domain-containing protein, partial [Klebsiella pneumoniae]|uniref:FAD-binding domain-containing protein n=1 Tax=Klebsiella pneumoniae TaxID=573 RepID=UPI0027D77235
LVYQQLLEEGDILLAADLLASRDVVIGPGGDASLNMPLEAEAAPYFRIFNPTTQGEKFDKQGVFIRRWLPELAKVPEKALHQP